MHMKAQDDSELASGPMSLASIIIHPTWGHVGFSHGLTKTWPL